MGRETLISYEHEGMRPETSKQDTEITSLLLTFFFLKKLCCTNNNDLLIIIMTH